VAYIFSVIATSLSSLAEVSSKRYKKIAIGERGK
jgi:hypothetical protein